MTRRAIALAVPAAALALGLVPAASAHACYVAGEDAPECVALDPDPEPLARALGNPLALTLLTLSLAAPVAAVLAWRRGLDRVLGAPWSRARETLRSYEDLLPWMLRLSLGIALAAAGSVGYLLSPLAADAPAWATIAERALGFLLLLGFLVRPVAVAVIALYAWALGGGVATPHQLLGVAELVGAALALLVLGGGRPGLDHLAQNAFFPSGRLGAALARRPGWLGRAAPFTPLVLRVAFAVTFAYGALTEKILHPALGMAVAEAHGLTAVLSAEAWVLLVGAVELYIALLFLVGFATRATSVASFLVLTATMAYFGESLASHVTLFGVASWLFVTGAGPLSVDRRLNPSAGRGPSKLTDVRRALAD